MSETKKLTEKEFRDCIEYVNSENPNIIDEKEFNQKYFEIWEMAYRAMVPGSADGVALLDTTEKTISTASWVGEKYISADSPDRLVHMIDKDYRIFLNESLYHFGVCFVTN